MTSRTAIVVVGMHRSGTSALTRMLSLLGASLPRNLYVEELGNETGHWEPEAAIRLNDQILDLAGSPVNDVHGPSPAWLETPAATAFVDTLKDMIVAEYGDAPLFVLKDPRIALLFPLWQAALAKLNIRCVAAIISRNPAEVALSLAKRQGQAGDRQSWPLERGGLVWLRYNLAAEEHTRTIDRAFCDYAQLLDDWRSVAARLSDDLDIPWPISIADATSEIDSFLSQELRHHREPDDLGSRPGIWSAWIAPVFAELRGAGQGHQPDPAVFSAVRQSFDEIHDGIRHPISQQPIIGGSQRCIRVMRRGQGRRRLCLVGDLFWKPAPGAKDERTAIDAAIASDIDVSIVEIGTFQLADVDTFAEFAASHGFGVEYLDIDDPPIQPSFLASTILLLRYARGQAFDAVLFQDRDGLGYASAVAKETDLAFGGVPLAVVAMGSSGCSRQQHGEFPSNLMTIGIEYLEKMAVEFADFVILPRPEIAQWMTEQGWRTITTLSIGNVASEDDWCRAFQRMLPETGTSVKPTPRRDAGDTTILITSYEQPRLLEQNLRGLMRQTEKGFSVVVVDDGSRGAEARRYLETVEDRYRALNLKLVRQENGYLGAARNTGIRAATTEFVILLDDDNVAFPDMVRTLCNAARTSKADVVTCGIKHFHDETQPPNAATHGNGTEHYFSAGPILLGSIHNCFGDCSGIYRTDIFDQVGGFHEIYGVTYEDWQMHLRIAVAGFRILSLPEPLLWYRIRKASMLRSTRPYTNARVIASVIDSLPSSALAPLSDYLIGTELEQSRLNRDLERLGGRAILERQTTQAIIATGLTGEVGRYVGSLQAALEERSKSASEAARYANSLESTLAEMRAANETATEYAKGLEKSRAEMEIYAKTLEAELKKINSANRR